MRNKLFFFGNYEQIHAAGRDDVRPHVLNGRGAAGHLPLPRRRRRRAHRQPARHRAAANGLPSTDRSVRRAAAPDDQQLARQQRRRRRRRNLLPNTFASSSPQTPNVNIYPTARVDYQATQNLGDARRAEPAVARPADATRTFPGCRRSTTGSRRRTTSSRPARTGRSSRTCSTSSASARRATTRSSAPATRSTSTRRRPASASTCRSWTSRRSSRDQLPIPAQQPGLQRHEHADLAEGQTHLHVRRHVPPHDDVRVDRRRAARRSRSASAPAIRRRASSRRRRCRASATADLTNAQCALRAARPAASAPPAARYNLDENTKQYGLNPGVPRARRRTSAASSRRISGASTRQLTLNYGLRWEFSGAGDEHQRRLQQPDHRGSARPVDGAVPARDAQRHR